MNKAYRSVWNETTGTWVAVQENATVRGKRASRRAARVLNAAVIVGAGTLAATGAHAAGAGGEPGGDPVAAAAAGGVAQGGEAGVANAGAASTATEAAPGSVPGPNAATLFDAAPPGSGVSTAGLNTVYKTAAYYSQVAGVGDSIGSTPPSDVARAYGAGSIAIGSNSVASGVAGTAVGVQAFASANDAVALGSGSVANQANTVSVGNDGTASYTAWYPNGQSYTIRNAANTRRVVNMAAGQADTDAVNVSQLKGVASALGGGTQVNADGSVGQPSYVLSGTTYNDVGSALEAVNTAARTGVADAVLYDSAAHNGVTLGGTNAGAPVRLSNVANATRGTDAVNLSQLEAAGLNVDGSGNVTNAFVAYDDTSKATVTLGGANGTKVRNVAAGAVSASSTEAVNGAQLYATNQQLGQNTGDIGNIQNQLADAVVYDSSAHDQVTLGGATAATPVQLSNVANGQADHDAVNVSQLKSAGLDIDGSGNVMNAFVAYDDASKATVTLGGANGTKVRNVAAGAVSASSTEAVNGAQLYATNQQLGQNTGDIGNIQNQLADAVVYDSSAHDQLTLGGANGTTIHNVAAGAGGAGCSHAVNGAQLYATNQQLGQNTGDIGNIQNQLADVVTYDSQAHTSVTLGGSYANAPVVLHNVAEGRAGGDAVNVSQLVSAGFTLDDAGYVRNKAVTFDVGSVAIGAPTITLEQGRGDSQYFRNGNRQEGLLPAGTRIVNVANGIQDTDAANVGQVYDIMNESQSGNGAGGSPYGATAYGATAFGAAQFAAAAPGSGVDTSGLNTTYKTAAYYSQVAGVGDSTGSTPPSDMARAAALGAIAIGSNAVASGVASTAMGVQAFASANDAVALGSGSVANEANTVSVGNDGTRSYTAWSPNGQSYTIQNGANTRRIVNMAAGEADTDAVNVSQLKGVTSALGGGAAVNADGSVEAPSYVVGGRTYDDVGSALAAVTAAATGSSADAVMYDSATHDRVTLGGTTGVGPAVQLSNVANGQADTDAVNVSQLKAAGLDIDGSGNVTNAFVAYDDASKETVTLGSANGTRIGNVAAGDVSASSSDAVNGAQLYATNQQLGQNTGDIGNIQNQLADVVTYDSQAHTSVTLGGSYANAPVVLHNVAEGRAGGDAVNVSQLMSAGFALDDAGYVRNRAVTYDAGSIAAGAPTLALEEGAGYSRYFRNGNRQEGLLPAGTRISNVADGIQDTDAANIGQLYNAMNQTGTVDGPAHPYAFDALLTRAAPQGSGVDTSGLVVTYKTAAYYSQVAGVGDSSGSTPPSDVARVAAAGAIAIGSNTVAGSLASTAVGVQSFASARDAVALGSGSVANQENTVSVGSDGTASYTAYDANGQPYTIHNPANTRRIVNMAAGLADTDAANVGQLKGVTDALGGGATVNADGSVAAPSYVVAGGTYNDVASALRAVEVAAGTGSADAVVYDSSAHTTVTLGGTGAGAPVQLANVANGRAETDAVNVSQLKAAGLDVDQSGNVTNAFVAYDDASKRSVTLGGTGATGPVALHNVASAAQDNDAVNLAQLKAAGLNVDQSGNVTNAFVAYDDASKRAVTLGGTGATGPVALHNVASAAQDNDAVNLAQLKAAGLNVDPSGNVTNAFVSYDDASKGSITLAGTNGTTITHVANGDVSATSTDAVNGSQLYSLREQINGSGIGLVLQDATSGTITVGRSTNGNLVDFTGTAGARQLTGVAAGAVGATSADAVNGSQLYGVAQSTASALGGGSTVNADGTVSAPTYVIGGTTVNNVGDALTNLDGRVTQNTSDITNLQKSVTQITGSVANAVQYDSSAHDQVTLGGTDATSRVKLTNLQDADLTAISTDAVTGQQLYATNQQVANLGQAIQNIGDTGTQYISTNTSSGPASATGSSSVAVGGGAAASGAGSTALGDKAAASADNSVALGSNSVADRANTVSVGSQGAERQITNVADGRAPTDAVNMRQFQSGMTSLQRGAYGGVAAATALTMIPDVDQGKTLAVGIGTANYKGYQATALGASARVTQNLKVKLGAGYSAGGGTTFGGGMSYQW